MKLKTKIDKLKNKLRELEDKPKTDKNVGLIHDIHIKIAILELWIPYERS